jgi:hypothetical protein
MAINHRNQVIYINGRYIEAYLMAHCLDSVFIIRNAYLIPDEVDKHLTQFEQAGKIIVRDWIERGFAISVTAPSMNGVGMIDEYKGKFNVSGKYKGSWTCGGQARIVSAKLTLKQRGRKIRGSLRYSERIENVTVETIENIYGLAIDDIIIIDGISEELRSKVPVQLSHDNFQLRISGGNSVLVGVHKCGIGSGEALFKRCS